MQELETPIFRKRIGEVTAARREAEQRAAKAEERIKELERQLGLPPTAAEAPAPEPESVPVPVEPIADAKVDTEIAANQAILEFCARNPDGVVDHDFGQGNVRTFTREDIARIQTTANTKLAELVAERGVQRAVNRQARLTAVEQEIGKAAATYPWLKDANSPQAKAAMAMGRQNPQLQNPQGVWDICAAVDARFARQASTSKPAVTNPVTKPARPTPVVARPAGAAPAADRNRGNDKALAEALQVAEQSGNRTDWAKYLALKRQSQHRN